MPVRPDTTAFTTGSLAAQCPVAWAEPSPESSSLPWRHQQGLPFGLHHRCSAVMTPPPGPPWLHTLTPGGAGPVTSWAPVVSPREAKSRTKPPVQPSLAQPSPRTSCSISSAPAGKRAPLCPAGSQMKTGRTSDPPVCTPPQAICTPSSPPHRTESPAGTGWALPPPARPRGRAQQRQPARLALQHLPIQCLPGRAAAAAGQQGERVTGRERDRTGPKGSPLEPVGWLLSGTHLGLRKRWMLVGARERPSRPPRSASTSSPSKSYSDLKKLQVLGQRLGGGPGGGTVIAAPWAFRSRALPLWVLGGEDESGRNAKQEVGADLARELFSASGWPVEVAAPPNPSALPKDPIKVGHIPYMPAVPLPVISEATPHKGKWPLSSSCGGRNSPLAHHCSRVAMSVV